MKKLHKLIVLTYIGPFVLTFFITLFILVMQFLWKYIDDMVGKGLEWYIIAELLFYATANLVPLALPLAILLSSIMTFGNLGEHYELVALKSAGLSLQRIMFPLIIFIILTSGAAFYFSNNIWPVANLKMASLLYDVRQKKPSLDIKEKIYYKGIEGYVIRIGKKHKNGEDLEDVTIYDHTENRGNVKVVKAETGKMQMSADKRFLYLTLYDGRNYEEVRPSETTRKSHPLFRSKFKEEKMRFDLSAFAMMRTDEELFKDNYQMLNLAQLKEAVDTLKVKFVERQKEFAANVDQKIFFLKDSLTIPAADTLLPATDFTVSDRFSSTEKFAIFEIALNLTRNTKVYVSALAGDFDSKRLSINRHKIEWHRKFTLSIACIVLFFIGAPLGAIIRKGGLGTPVVISVLFFMVFHVLSITGEKLVKENSLEAFQGMWLATACLLPVGIFLTYKATSDSPIMEMDTYKKVFDFIGNKLFPKKEM